MRFQGRWIILDGVHRLLKAEMLGETAIRAMVLSDEDYASIVYSTDEGYHSSHIARGEDDVSG